jgi:hypothetical protein
MTIIISFKTWSPNETGNSIEKFLVVLRQLFDGLLKIFNTLPDEVVPKEAERVNWLVGCLV